MRWALLAAVLGLISFARADLVVEVTHTFAGQPLRFEQRQAMEDGREVAVTRLDYFVTEFALLTPDGRALRADGQSAFLSVGKERTTFRVPDAPPGQYVGVAFRVGVPAADNARDPAAWPAGHPLNPAVNGLHWGWQGGYVFLALEGRVGGGGFSYHLARAENLMTVRLEQPIEIARETTLQLRFEIAPLFAGLEMRPRDGSNSTHSAPDDQIAAQLRARVPAAWKIAEVRAGATPLAPVLAPVNVPAGTTAYRFPVPHGFPAPELPADNPLTVEGIALGEQLFRDPQLSLDRSQSCASCHDPAHGFADPRRVSLGVTGDFGRRNAPALLNLAWGGQFAWDGRRASLRAAALAPISDEREMAMPLERVVARLAADAAYPVRFAKAFGVEEKSAVTPERLGLALEQFLLTRFAASSKFDRMMRGEAKLSEEEALGFELFFTERDPVRGKWGADCFHCHGGFNFSDQSFHDIGLGGPDPGRFAATGNEPDRGKFKTPTLRNLVQTAPYFHDGRARTLGEAVAHYDRDVRRTPNLDPNLAKRGPLDLAPWEHHALVMFLRTLTDDPPVKVP